MYDASTGEFFSIYMCADHEYYDPELAACVSWEITECPGD
jgi:hypothetical protein